MRHRKSQPRKSVIRNANYFIGEAVNSIMRNKLMSVSSVATIASCVFIVVFSLCLAVNIDYIFRQLEDTAGVVVFVKPELGPEEIEVLKQRILEVEFVAGVKFSTADEEFEKFIERQGDGGRQHERLRDNNPFRPAFEVELTNTRQIDNVVYNLEQLYGYGAQDVRQPSDVFDFLIMVNNVIRVVGIVIVLVLGALSVVIVMNTIKLTVNNRRHEISIMKYVGATDMFVRWPFILEGIIIGLFGAAIPVVIVAAAYNRAVNMIIGSLSFVEFLFTLRAASDILPFLIPGALLIGAGIGAAGSIVSMRRYLRA
jgi:cell division transport system permease protein